MVVGCIYIFFYLAVMLVLLPSQSAVEEEDEEQPSPTTPEKEPEKSVDPPEPTNLENNLPPAQVQRSACLLVSFSFFRSV